MAYEKARRTLLDKVIIYLDSNPEIKDLHLDKDIVSALTVVAFRPEIVCEKSYGGSYYIKARITADNKQFQQYYKAVQGEPHKMQELVLLKKWLDESFIEAEKRRKELDATPILDRQRKIDPYMQLIKRLSTSNDYVQGYSYVLFGKHREAIDSFTRVIDRDPNNSAAYYNRGLSYLSLKNKQLAIQDFESCMKGVVVNTNRIIGYRDPNSLISENEDPEEIIRKMSKAVDMKSDDADAFYNRGTAYLVTEKYNEAMSDFSSAIELRPQVLDYYYNRKVAWQRSLDSNKFTVELPPSMAEYQRRRMNAIQEATERAKKKQEDREARERRVAQEQKEMYREMAERENEWLEIEKRRSGRVGANVGRGIAIDPRTGQVYPMIGPNLAIDPRSGRVIPAF